MKKQIWIVIFVVVVVVVFAVRFGQKPGEQGTIKIGAVLGLTGPAATWSEYAKKAAYLAVKEINDGGGVNGKKLEIIYEDGKTSPAGSVSAFQKLTSVDGAPVVIGDVWAFITNPLIPITDQKKVVLISPTIMDKSVEGKSDYFYTLGHTVDSQRNAVNKFIDINSKAKTAAILCWDDTWGRAHEELYKSVLRSRGITIVGDECTADFSNDYRTLITKIKAANPGIILAVASGGGVSFMRARYDLGVTAPTLLTNVVVDALDVQHMPRQNALGIYFTNWLPDQGFIKKFQTTYGVPPIMENQTSYEAIRSIAKAIGNNPHNVLAGLQRVKYEGVDGPIDFTTTDHTRIDNAVAKLYRVDTGGYTEL